MGREDAARTGSQSSSAREAGLSEAGPVGAGQRRRLKPRDSQVCVRDERTKITPERRDRDTRQETEPRGAARASAGTAETGEDPRPGVGRDLFGQRTRGLGSERGKVLGKLFIRSGSAGGV